MVEVLLQIFMAHMLGLGYWLKKTFKKFEQLVGMRLPKSLDKIPHNYIECSCDTLTGIVSIPSILPEIRIEGILHYKLFK